MEAIMRFIGKLPGAIMCSPLDAITVFLALLALLFAWYIPRRIMLNNMYADLVREYRSPAMGGAVLALFQFYVHDCKNNVSQIAPAYTQKYAEQIGSARDVDFSKTLHFQRRLIAQFYFDMACLRYNYFFPRLSAKTMKMWFTGGEKQLLSLLLHMAEPARQCFEQAENLDAPPHNDEDAAMNRLICRLYEEAEGFE